MQRRPCWKTESVKTPHDGLEEERRPWRYRGACLRSPYTSTAWTDCTVFATCHNNIIIYCRTLCVANIIQKVESIYFHNINLVISVTMASYVGDESVQDSTTTSASTSSVATEGSSVKGKQGKQRLCPHCLDVVSRATYFRHKRAFYDHQTKEWKSESQVSSAAAGEVGSDCATPLDDGMRGFLTVWHA